MEAYSLDLRQRVVRAVDEQRGTQQAIAELFGVSARWIRKLLQQRRATGSIAPRPHGGGQPAKFAGARLQRLQALVAHCPDATLAELQKRSRVAASRMAVWRALRRLRVSHKKSRSGPPSKTAPTCKPSAPLGGSVPRRWTRAASSSSMKVGPRPT